MFERVDLPLVIDADGLNALAGVFPGGLPQRSRPTVLTPHAGELGRLLEVESAEVERRRLHHARAAAARVHAIVVLKGDDTLVASPSGRVAISRGGAPGLATAGTGDVLSGVTGAMLAKGLPADHAACAAVWAHVRAGRLAAEPHGPDAVIASDVIEHLPAAFAV
jgi:ADP-dependent NAD(P)H-hydrate dehydratase / NAD(P)H-hydrate epimerase